MEIREIMSRPVVTVEATETLVHAAHEMRVHRIGALPVRQGGTLVGMVTDRDIVTRGIALGADPDTTSVEEVMTPAIACCEEDAPLWEAAEAMRDAGVHRLVVTNGEGDAVGIVASDDLARAPREALIGPPEVEQAEALEALEED